jgi:hypothetical protein
MKRSLVTTFLGLAVTLGVAGPASADATIVVGLFGAGGGRVADTKGHPRLP